MAPCSWECAGRHFLFVLEHRKFEQNTIILIITSLTATALPATLLGAADAATWLAVATIVAGTFITTWETLRTPLTIED